MNSRSTSLGRLRTLGAALALSGTVVAASGCATLSQQTTDLQYDAADGVSGRTGAVELTNVLLTTPGSGSSATLHGAVRNPTGSPAEITVTGSGGAAQRITVPAHSTVSLGGTATTSTSAPTSSASATAPTIDGVTQKAGQTVTLSFAARGATPTTLRVPLLLAQEPYGTATVTHAPPATPTGEGGEGAGEGH